ncbi:MAG TPA: response regulator [Bryobacteraceae bacterium]|jgi:two-component system NtrC family sensor kinase
MNAALKRVLLVEDSPTQAERLRQLLSNDDLAVVQVATAELALKELESDRPDIIVLDNHLPGMTGNDFCREIRLNVNTRAIPVLMLTVENSDAAQMQGLASGADDYVNKSVDPDILRVRIRALLRKSESDPAVPDVESRFSRARVLLIDDSPTYLHLLKRALATEHYHIETTTEPEEGLRILERFNFDCVVVDFEMPGLTGADVCRRIRLSKHGEDPEIVLIIYSSHEDKQRMTEGFDAGADDYISKSSDISVTKARIRALLRRKFLVEENRRIHEEIREKEMQAIRARAEQASAQIRAQMADQLAAANFKLDRANKELEQFAYAAAHDLQEPLRQITVFSELLRQEYIDKLDEKAVRFLDFCVDGASRMRTLIDDLLQYARASQCGSGAVAMLDLRVVIDHVIESLHVSTEESHATVQVSPLPTLLIEEVPIRQLFLNLIGNGLKYRRPEVPPEIKVWAEQATGEWVFSVSDNGIGIEAGHCDRIFDPFTRLNSGERRGAGLGLAICKRIVENCGGRIWVESEPGKGSTFRFTLPLPGTAPN